MKTNILYNGDLPFPEDAVIFYPNFVFGAIDGVSGIYLPEEGPRMFDGRTGGQIASQAICNAAGTASSEERLEDILRDASATLREIIISCGLPLEHSELLPSAAFVLAKNDDSGITIMQGGDSLAVWELADGTVGGTPNKFFYCEKYLLDTIAELMEKHGENRQKMWQEFRPILAERRRATINTSRGGFAILNGQPEFERFWQKFEFKPREIKLLILFSDGLVPFKWTKDEKRLARRVINLYRKGEVRNMGLQKVLRTTRKIAEKNKSTSHVDKPEATAIAIEF